MRIASLFAAVLLFTACPSDDDPVTPPVTHVDAGTLDARPSSPDAATPEPVDAGPRTPSPVWGACDDDRDCEADLRCVSADDHADDGPGSTCRPVVVSCEGNPCGEEAYCRQYLTSGDGGQDVDFYFCEQRKAAGEACNVGHDKDVNVCTPGLRCRNEHCEAAPVLNQPCDDNFEFAACADGLACAYQPGGLACQMGGGQNQSCSEDFHCGPGLHCDRFLETCQPRAAKGGACFDLELGCGVGLECQFDAGLTCENWIDCGSQMDCCAVEGGAECRVFDGHTHCEPPAGQCETRTFLDNDL